MRGDELVIVDVGHGNAAVLANDRDAIVIDAGRGASLLEYLLREGIENVSTVVISHADDDHVGGLVGLLGSDSVQIGQVLVNADGTKTTMKWKDLSFELDDRRRRGELGFEIGLSEGRTIPYESSDIRVEVVAPRARLTALGVGNTDETGARIESNSLSAVVRISWRERASVLLSGDLDALGLRHLLDAEVDITAHTLIFPHHGGHTRKGASDDEDAAFAEQLCNAVQPVAVVFSISRGQHGLPRPVIVQAVRRTLPEAWIACTQLSPHCATEVPDRRADHLLERHAAGDRRRACCAGTIRLGLADNTLAPVPTAHTAFVGTSAPTALCRPVPPAEVVIRPTL